MVSSISPVVVISGGIFGLEQINEIINNKFGGKCRQIIFLSKQVGLHGKLGETLELLCIIEFR